MFESIIVGVSGIVSLMIIWIVIQSWWRRTFSDNITDDDVLAGRTHCSNCGCTTVCRENGSRISKETNYNQ